jgi:hypothetical protein
MMQSRLVPLRGLVQPSRVTPEHATRGTVVQAENPLWAPLETVVGTELAGWFMWMSEIRLRDGTRVDAYKHVATRRYLHLGQTGTAFVHDVENRYLPMDLAAAITDAFNGWECGRPAPGELRLLAATVASARRLAA